MFQVALPVWSSTALTIPLTLLIIRRNISTHKTSYLLTILYIGSVLYFVDLVIAITLLESHFAETFLVPSIEECLKTAGAVVLQKYARPMAVIAAFAFAELAIGKLCIMYFLSSPDVRIVFETHGTYVTFATTAAYLMHITSGLTDKQ